MSHTRYDAGAYVRTDGVGTVGRVSELHESTKHHDLSSSLSGSVVAYGSVHVSRVPARYTGVTLDVEACGALWVRSGA